MMRYTVNYEWIPPALWFAPTQRRIEALTPGVHHEHFALAGC